MMGLISGQPLTIIWNKWCNGQTNLSFRNKSYYANRLPATVQYLIFRINIAQDIWHHGAPQGHKEDHVLGHFKIRIILKLCTPRKVMRCPKDKKKWLIRYGSQFRTRDFVTSHGVFKLRLKFESQQRVKIITSRVTVALGFNLPLVSHSATGFHTLADNLFANMVSLRHVSDLQSEMVLTKTHFGTV